MRLMKKISASIALCGFCIAALTTPFSSLSAAAYDTTKPYKFILQPERTFVSAEELEAGDVHIRTNVYLQGDSDVAMRAFILAYEASSDYIYFDNSLDIYEYLDEQTYTYSGGTFTSKYKPYCFGKIASTKTGFKPSGSATTASSLIEPMSGAPIYSDGNGGIYFVRSYNMLVDGVQTWISNEKVEIPADQIQVLDNGHATFTYDYYYQEPALGFPERTNTFEMPYYDATLEAGTLVKGENDVCYWTKDATQDSASFFGYSDEFPCFSFDIVLRQGTPNGTYDVTLDEEMCKLRDADQQLLPLEYVNTTIAVGTASATVTEDKTSPYYCFYAENDMEIRLNQLDGSLLSAVAYEDGTTSSSALEAIATCGQSPAELYAQQDGTAFIDDVTFSLESQPLQNEDGTAYTKKILVGKKGDANLDGVVDVEDAVAILQYYAQQSAGLQPSISDDFTEEEATLSYFLADIDTCSQDCGADGGTLDVEDAVQVLSYYAQQAAGLQPTWNNR